MFWKLFWDHTTFQHIFWPIGNPGFIGTHHYWHVPVLQWFLGALLNYVIFLPHFANIPMYKIDRYQPLKVRGFKRVGFLEWVQANGASMPTTWCRIATTGSKIQGGCSTFREQSPRGNATSQINHEASAAYDENPKTIFNRTPSPLKKNLMCLFGYPYIFSHCSIA